jgi:hypothetical protein
VWFVLQRQCWFQSLLLKKRQRVLRANKATLVEQKAS